MASSSSGSVAAFGDGLGRVNRAWLLVAGMAMVTLLVGLPLAIALAGMIEAHLGRSLAAETAAAGTNYEWWQEFMASATGLGTTFVPSITGFGAVLENLSRLADNASLAPTIAGITAAWMVLWSFLSGGVIDRLARDRRIRTHGFFAACGVHFWRFLRLGVLAAVVYVFLFGWVHGWIFEGLYPAVTRDMTVERTAFFVRVAGYLLFAVPLLFFNALFDYARIRIVVEDRRSAIGAFVAAFRFVRRHPGRVAVLYGFNAVAFVCVIGAYALLTPGAPSSGASLWVALLLGQGYILARHYLKLLFYASQTALFQRTLAHAAYTAMPAPLWPDSPSAERIANAEPVTLH